MTNVRKDLEGRGMMKVPHMKIAIGSTSDRREADSVRLRIIMMKQITSVRVINKYLRTCV